MGVRPPHDGLRGSRQSNAVALILAFLFPAPIVLVPGSSGLAGPVRRAERGAIRPCM
jgi:hypothetical protein